MAALTYTFGSDLLNALGIGTHGAVRAVIKLEPNDVIQAVVTYNIDPSQAFYALTRKYDVKAVEVDPGNAPSGDEDGKA